LPWDAWNRRRLREFWDWKALVAANQLTQAAPAMNGGETLLLWVSWTLLCLLLLYFVIQAS